MERKLFKERNKDINSVEVDVPEVWVKEDY